jgi:hypothetical protein
VDAQHRRHVVRGRESLPGTHVAVGDVAANLRGDLLVKRHRLVSIHLDIMHDDKHSVTIVSDTRTALKESPPSPEYVDHELVIREARRRQRRRWSVIGAFIAPLVAVSVVVLISSTTAPRSTVAKGTERPTPKGIALVRSRIPLMLDLFWSEPVGYGSGANVSVNLSNGFVHASPYASAVYGLARRGYILGSTNTETVSMSYDLRHTLHTWTGKYGNAPVPANNPADIWVSSGNGATEVNQYERPVAPTVPIPADSGVEGQAGPNLVLIGAAPIQTLELWSPAQQRILATFGALEYSDAVPTVNQTSVVWSERDVVHIDRANGVAGQILVGPKGDVATSLDVSPDGSRVAIVFNPAPGTTNARTGGFVEIADVSNGSSMKVPGSAGAKDLLAWSPDGSRIFFPKFTRNDPSVSMATYRIGGQHASYFQVPGLRIPTDLTGATGSVVAVDAPSRRM